MTPFDASVPYSVAADGPLRTWIDSMSFGSRSLIREGVSPPPLNPTLFEPAVLSARTPSMKMIGSELKLSELTPRMRVTPPVPNWPLAR